MLEYSARDLQRVLSVSPLLLRALVEEGHVRPVERDGASRYSFEDLLTLRSASTLRQARVPTRKIRQALRALRDAAGGSIPALTRAPTGRGLAVSAGSRVWSYESGQYALPLEPMAPASVPAGSCRTGASSVPYAAVTHFTRALALEPCDPDGARLAYAACLAQAPDHLDARINLGRLLHRAGELTQATAVYRDAHHLDARLLLHFAAVLEEQSRFGEALEKYRRAVTLDPVLAERHCAAARLRAPTRPNFSC